MAEELQALLDRIQTEGVAKAEAEADRILAEAKKTAETIVANAKAEETAARERSAAEAEQFRERAEANVKQAARDVVLGVRKSVDDTLDRLLLAKVSGALDTAFVQKALSSLLPVYAASADAADGVGVEVPEAQVAAVRDALLGTLQAEAAKGLNVRSGDGLTAGFRVTLAGGRVEYDFSDAAIAEEMARLLRPELAKLMR